MWNLFDVAMDIVFLIDILINFRTGYVNRGMFVKDLELVAKRYLTTWFPIDVISSFPLTIITFAIESSAADDGAGQNRFSGINRLLRMLKLSKLFRIIKVARSLKFLSDLASFNPGMARLFASLLALVLVCHWVACFLYIVSYDQVLGLLTIYHLPLTTHPFLLSTFDSRLQSLYHSPLVTYHIQLTT